MVRSGMQIYLVQFYSKLQQVFLFIPLFMKDIKLNYFLRSIFIVYT